MMRGIEIWLLNSHRLKIVNAKIYRTILQSIIQGLKKVDTMKKTAKSTHLMIDNLPSLNQEFTHLIYIDKLNHLNLHIIAISNIRGFGVLGFWGFGENFTIVKAHAQ